uniref:Uncharacterized protein n=1 Tax=Rangifer tarandus platyrhynchus TaxID=3082113 RepID=A0ACB0DQB7_RANTA|nr:unnamed protein product [Rangifer tarandus platyrhynchus]
MPRGSAGSDLRSRLYPGFPRPSPRALRTARPEWAAEPRTTARPLTAGLCTPHLSRRGVKTRHPAPLPGAQVPSLVPSPAPPLVGSEGRDPTAPSWTERGGRGPSERYRHGPHLPEPDGRAPCASKLSGHCSSRPVGRSGTDRLADRPWFPEEPLPEAVRPQPTVREL